MFRTIVTFAILSHFTFTVSLAEDELEDFYVHCGGSDLYAWTMILCEIPEIAHHRNYILNVLPLNGDKDSGESMKTIDKNSRVAWCTFPPEKDQLPFEKGNEFKLHFQKPDLYLLALTSPSGAIIGKDYVTVRKFDCGDIRLEPRPSKLNACFFLKANTVHSAYKHSLEDPKNVLLSRAFFYAGLSIREHLANLANTIYTTARRTECLKCKIDFDGCDSTLEVEWSMARSYFLFQNEKNCFNTELIGEFDMAAFLSLDSFEPGEIQRVGKVLPVPVYARPFGITFFTAHFQVDGKEHFLTTFVATTNVKGDTVQNEVTVVFNPFPNEKLSWAAGRALTLDGSESFSRQLTPLSGFVGRPKSFLRFQWGCDGGLLCEKFTSSLKKEATKIRLPGDSLKEGETMQVKLTVQLMAQDLETVLFSRTESKNVIVVSSAWPPIELRCVFQCHGPTFLRGQIRLVRFYCPDCFSGDYSIKWRGCKEPPCLGDSVYYALQNKQEEVILEVMNTEGHKMEFGHKYRLQTQADLYTINDATIGDSEAVFGELECYDVKGGFEEVKHSLLYRYFYQTDTNVIWSSTFHQSVYSLPKQIRLKGQRTGIFPLHMYYIFLDRRSESMPREAKDGEERFGETLSIEQMETVWKSIQTHSKFTHSPLSWLYIFTNYLETATEIDDGKLQLYERMLEFILERKLTHTDAGIIQAMFQELMNAGNISPPEKFLSLYLQVWGAMMDFYIKHPVTPFSSCKVIWSISKMINKWFENEGAKKGTLIQATEVHFLNAVSKISRYRSYIDYTTDLTCQGLNWFVYWITVSFHFEDTYKYEPPAGVECYLKSVEIMKWAFRRAARLSKSGFIDYEAYVVIYVIARPSFIRVINYIASQTILVESIGRWNNERQDIFDQEGVLQFDINYLYRLPPKKELIMRVIVKGQRIVETDCMVLKVPVKSSHEEALIMFVPEEYQFGMAYKIVNNLREQVDFMLENHKWKLIKGKTVIQLPLKEKSYVFHYPGSHHMFLFKGRKSDIQRNGKKALQVSYAAVEAHCIYWNGEYKQWDTRMCVTYQYHPKYFRCKCKRLSGNYSTIVQGSNSRVNAKIDRNIANKEGRDGFFMLFFILLLWFIYIALLVWARRKNIQHRNAYRTFMSLRHFNPSDRYRHLICLRMSSIGGSELRSRAFLMLVGSQTTTGEMILDNYFLSGSESWFMASTPVPLGRILGCVLKVEYPDAQKLWHMRGIDVYSVEMRRLYILPFTKWLSRRDSSWYIHNPRTLDIHVPRGRYICDWIRNCFKKSHLLPNIFFPVPGAHNMVCDVTRLFCIVLSSLLVAVVFLSVWPTFDGVDHSDETAGTLSIIFYSPLVLAAGIILYILLILWVDWRIPLGSYTYVRMGILVCDLRVMLFLLLFTFLPCFFRLCYPVTTWRPLSPEHIKPLPRITGNRPLIEDQLEIKRPSHFRQSVDSRLSYSFQSSPEGGSDSATSKGQTGGGDMKVNNNRNNSAYSSKGRNVLLDNSQSVSKESVGSRTMMSGKFHPIISFEEPEREEDSDKDGEDEGEKKKMRVRSLDWKTDRLEMQGFDSIWPMLIYNLLVVVVIAFMLGASFYLAAMGYMHQLLIWDVLDIVGNALGMLAIHFFILFPLVIIAVAIVQSFRHRKMYTQVWAKERGNKAEKTVYFWKELERFHYKKRAEKIPAYDYKSHLDAHHTMLVMSFIRDKIASIKQKFTDSHHGTMVKGGIDLIIFIIIFAVLSHVHTKVLACFNQKTFAYNKMGLPKLDRQYIKESKTSDSVWDTIEMVLKNFQRFEFNLINGVAEQEIECIGIRQLRVKNFTESCPLRSSLKMLLFPRQRCQYDLNYENEENRDFGRKWIKEVGDKENEGRKPGRVDAAFLYTSIFAFQEIFSGSLDGYYYVSNSPFGDMLTDMKSLQEANWIDESTRLIIMEFSVFNLNNGIASAIQVLFEFSPHGVFLSSTCQSFPLTFKRSEYTILLIVLIVLAIITLRSYTLHFQLMMQLGRSKFWRSKAYVAEFLSSVNSTILLIMFAVRFYLSRIKMNEFASMILGSDEIIFVTLLDVANLVYAVNVVCAFVSFIILFKILKMASYVQRLNIMLSMFYDVFGLFVGPMIAIFGTSMGLLMVYQTKTNLAVKGLTTLSLYIPRMFYFHNLYRALTTTAQFLISPLKIHRQARDQARVMGPILIWIQWILFGLVIVNGFIAAINENFSVKNSEVESQEGKDTLESTYELMWNVVGQEVPDNKQKLEQEEKKKNEKMDKDFIDGSLHVGFVEGDNSDPSQQYPPDWE